jgi:hypothetical protein
MLVQFQSRAPLVPLRQGHRPPSNKKPDALLGAPGFLLGGQLGRPDHSPEAMGTEARRAKRKDLGSSFSMKRKLDMLSM